MITVITGLQLLVGERKLRRENRLLGAAPVRSSNTISQEKTA
jgi:iron(III) transport system permease protein